ncbi:hypothetical protein SLE2022_048900 [Rubroshorea leprosula]
MGIAEFLLRPDYLGLLLSLARNLVELHLWGRIDLIVVADFGLPLDPWNYHEANSLKYGNSKLIVAN